LYRIIIIAFKVSKTDIFITNNKYFDELTFMTVGLF